MKLDPLMLNLIGSADGRSSRVVVVEFPGRQRSVAANSTLDLDHSRRPEIGPGELLFTRPDQLHRPACGSRQSGSLQRRFTAVLPSIGRTCVRNQHSNAVLRNVEGTCQLAANSKGPLRSRPDGELTVLPFGHGGARL